MTVDLSAAIEAASRGSYEAAPGEGPEWDLLPDQYRHDVREIAFDFVTHAAPLIEAAVRAQVAAEIEAERLAIKGGNPFAEVHDLYDRGRLYGMSVAEHIARGES